MTTNEIIDAVSQLDLQSMSDEELSKVRATLSLKTSEADWILNGRKHYKTHFAPKENN